MEIDNVVFQGLDNVGKRRVFKVESFGFLFRKIIKYPKMNNLVS